MGKKEKLKDKLDQLPKNFTWDEFVSLLNHYGFVMLNARGGGSGRKFFNKKHNRILQFHEPHPENTMKKYILKETKVVLEEIDANEKSNEI